MASAVKLRTDFSSVDLPRLAKKSRDGYRAWRLLALAAVFDGMNRAEAAQIDGMDRQTLRDWVHRFNTEGPEGLLDHKAAGGVPRLSPEQKAELSQLVETGPDFGVDGVVRWRRVDLQCVIKQRFGVEYHERYVGKILKSLGFSHISARPRHPGQDAETIQAFKKTSALRCRLIWKTSHLIPR